MILMGVYKSKLENILQLWTEDSCFLFNKIMSS